MKREALYEKTAFDDDYDEETNQRISNTMKNLLRISRAIDVIEFDLNQRNHNAMHHIVKRDASSQVNSVIQVRNYTIIGNSIRANDNLTFFVFSGCSSIIGSIGSRYSSW